jgi:hypothetical protein
MIPELGTFRALIGIGTSDKAISVEMRCVESLVTQNWLTPHSSLKRLLTNPVMM